MRASAPRGLPSGSANPGLVVHLELTSFQGQAEVGLKRQALDGAVVEVVIEDLVAVPSGLFGPVHRNSVSRAAVAAAALQPGTTTPMLAVTARL